MLKFFANDETNKKTNEKANEQTNEKHFNFNDSNESFNDEINRNYNHFIIAIKKSFVYDHERTAH